MKKMRLSLILIALSSAASVQLQAAEVCKVSMMGRVCFEEGSEQATSAHMKGDAVADSAKKKVADKEDVDGKKLVTK